MNLTLTLTFLRLRGAANFTRGELFVFGDLDREKTTPAALKRRLELTLAAVWAAVCALPLPISLDFDEGLTAIHTKHMRGDRWCARSFFGLDPVSEAVATEVVRQLQSFCLRVLREDLTFGQGEYDL